MKKLLVSMMLILSMFAFAAESAASATVGYVKYPCVVGTNFVGIPMQDDFTMASAFDANFNAVRTWNQVSQAWDVTNKPLWGEWIGDFAIVSGQAYLVNSEGAFDLIVDDEVLTNPAYDLVTGSNALMVPLTKSNMAMASDYNTETGTVDAVRKWNQVTQLWDVTNKPLWGEWIGDFAVGIGDPHFVNSTGPVTWPGAKGEYDNNNVATGGIPKGPKSLIFGALDLNGQELTNVDSLTFKAVLTQGAGPALGLVTDIDDNFPSCTAQMTQYSAVDFRGSVVIEMGNFDAWGLNNVVTVTMKDWVAGKGGYYYGTAAWTVNDAGSGPTYEGFLDVGFGGQNNAIALTTLSSIDGNNTPLETSLEQNYPNPFNPTTTINFSIKSEGIAKLNVYNYTGQLVNSLVNGQMNAGHHTVNFDASNLSAGVYYYTLEANNMTMTNKMVLVK